MATLFLENILANIGGLLIIVVKVTFIYIDYRSTTKK